MKNILVQLSGGYDSAAAAVKAFHHEAFQELHGLFVDYGQPYASQEWRAAQYTARFLGKHTRLHRVNTHLELTQHATVKEYVPMRNLVLSALSVNGALAWGCDRIVAGSKTMLRRSGDPYSFADSAFLFYDALQLAVLCGCEDASIAPRFSLPLLNWTKVQVVKYLDQWGVDRKKLWSCYRAGRRPCGRCYHCEEIKKAELQLRKKP